MSVCLLACVCHVTGSFLASGGQDGRIIIWSVGLADGDSELGASSSNAASSSSAADNSRTSKSTSGSAANVASAAAAATTAVGDMEGATGFKLLSRTPYHIFQGHVADVIDLAWSKSNFLLSASVDKTVRLWHVSRDDCLQVFRHNDIVTGIAFHPTHDRYFVSSCFDRRVRIWDIIPDGVVKDWCHVRAIVLR